MKFRLILAFVVLAWLSLSAQTFRGTILGTVTDPTGAVVAGAQVKVHSASTGLDRTTVTSADGSYTVPELPIGAYDVTVTQTRLSDLRGDKRWQSMSPASDGWTPR